MRPTAPQAPLPRSGFVHGREAEVDQPRSHVRTAPGEDMALTRDELVARLTRAGELEVSGEDQAETDSYFDMSKFRFHGPDGFEADYAGPYQLFQVRTGGVRRSLSS